MSRRGHEGLLKVYHSWVVNLGAGYTNMCSLSSQCIVKICSHFCTDLIGKSLKIKNKKQTQVYMNVGWGGTEIAQYQV